MPKKGENIYKRKDNRWEARYVKGYSCDGKIQYGYCYGKSYREAKEKVSRIKAALITGQTTQTNSHVRFSIICDEWLTLNRSKIKESSFVKYSTNIENHIKPFLGGYFINAITSVIVEQFSYDLLNEKALSAKTVRDILTELKAILHYAYSKLPFLQPIGIVFPKMIKKELRVLTRDEQHRFIQYLLQDLDSCKFGVLLSLLTGLRIGEICALKWKDISIVDMCVNITLTMQRLRNNDKNCSAKTKIIVSEPKSESSLRSIPLTDYIIDLCRLWEGIDSNAYVLTGKPDKFMEPRALQYRLSKYTKDCNLQGVHYHVLRHTFATRCVEVGFEIKSLSEVLGHSSPRITLERYVHPSMELKRDNMRKLSTIGY